MTYTYKPQGVCSSQIDLDIEDGIIKDVAFVGGCNGNLSGIARLVKDRTAAELISILSGTLCGRKSTSCPDQLAKAIEAALAAEAKQ